MSKQRMITTGFWSDPWVVEELNPLDRYLFLYLLTNEHTTIGGIYELAMRTMSNESGIEKEELARMLKRLESRVVFVDGWVVFRKAIMHQNIGSPKIKSAIAQTIKLLPPQLLHYVQVPADFGELLKSEYGIDTVSIWYPNGIQVISHSNLNSNSNSNINSAKADIHVKLGKPTARAAADKPDSEKKPGMNGHDFFDRLVTELGFTNRVMATPGRLQKMKARLKKFTPKEMVQAARIIAADPYMQGDNDSGTRYGKIDYLLRNDENVAKWLESEQQQAVGPRKTFGVEDLKKHA